MTKCGCPQHGEKETLIHQANRKLRSMSITELKGFVRKKES